MGRVYLNSLIVTGNSRDIVKAHEYSKESLEEALKVKGFIYRGIITHIFFGMNDLCSFAILPLGSKYGWEAFNIYNEAMDSIRKYVKELKLYYCYTVFHDDEGRCEIDTYAISLKEL